MGIGSDGSSGSIASTAAGSFGRCGRRRGGFRLLLQFRRDGSGLPLRTVFGSYGSLSSGRSRSSKRLGNLRHIEVRERKSRHIVLVLHKGVKVGEAGDFGLQYQRLNLPVDGEVASCAGAVEVRLAQPLDLDFADELRSPTPRRSAPLS